MSALTDRPSRCPRTAPRWAPHPAARLHKKEEPHELPVPLQVCCVRSSRTAGCARPSIKLVDAVRNGNPLPARCFPGSPRCCILRTCTLERTSLRAGTCAPWPDTGAVVPHEQRRGKCRQAEHRRGRSSAIVVRHRDAQPASSPGIRRRRAGRILVRRPSEPGGPARRTGRRRPHACDGRETDRSSSTGQVSRGRSST